MLAYANTIHHPTLLPLCPTLVTTQAFCLKPAFRLNTQRFLLYILFTQKIKIPQ